MARLLVILLCASVAGCVIDTRERDYSLYSAPRTTQFTPDGRIEVRIPAGEVEFVEAEDSDFHAELEVFCPAPDSHCARKLADLDWQVDNTRRGTVVSLQPHGAFASRNADVRIRVALPAAVDTHIDMKAGELIANVNSCLTVDMEAGDLRITVPESLLRSAALDVGIGDAAIRSRGKTRDGRRSVLVGAESYWDNGPGNCDMKVDLQVGDGLIEIADDRLTGAMANR